MMIERGGVPNNPGPEAVDGDIGNDFDGHDPNLSLITFETINITSAVKNEKNPDAAQISYHRFPGTLP